MTDLAGNGHPVRRWLWAVDRSSWMAAIGCVCALGFALQRLPFTADDLLARSLELQTPQGGPESHVYAAIQGHPTETCAAFGALEPPVLAAIGADAAAIKARTASEPSRIAQLVRGYSRDIRRLFLTPPVEASCWKEDTNSAYFQSRFPIDSPYMWMFRRLNVSTIHVALALIVGAWLGMVCLFLAARRLTGSAAGGILTVALSQYVWDRWALPGGTHYFVFNAFVPVYAGQLLCASRPIVAARHWAVRASVEGVVIGLIALHSLLQIFAYPVAHRLNAAVIVGVVGGVGLLLRDQRVILRAVALAVALYIVTQPYYRETRRLFAQLTTVNLAAGEEYTAVMGAIGMFERPTYLGLPSGDYAFTWVRAMDAYLFYNAPHLAVHQSFNPSGRTLLYETIFRHPLTLIEAGWKRVLIQTVYHRHLNAFWYYKHDASASRRNAAFLTAVAVFGLVCAFSIAYPSSWPLLWPPAALIAWQLFGVDTLFTFIHVHTNYVFSGLFLLLTLAPAMAVCAWRQREEPRAAAVRAWVHAASHSLRRPRVAVLASAVLALGAIYGVREVRKEITAFWLWYPVHVGADETTVGQEAWRSPSQLAETARALQALGHDPPGAVEIHAAWVFWVYIFQNGLYLRGPAAHNPALQAQYKAEADAYMHAFYREALDKAPADPHIGSYALMMNEPDWPAIFRKSLGAAPDHHHAAYMVYNLIRLGAPPAEVRDLIRIYETDIERMFVATASSRPGYVRRPAIAGVSTRGVAGGSQVRLRSGQTVSLPAIALEGAPKLRVGLYVDVRVGAVRISAVSDAARAHAAVRCSSADVSSQTIEHYWYVDCGALEGADAIRLTVTALDTDATVVLRDYYPMFSVVRVPS
jgi:hypothetical protein